MSIVLKSTINTVIEVEVSVDLGNSMLKGATEFGGQVSVAKLPNRTTVEGTLSDRVRCIEMNDEKLYVGVGKLNNNALKHTRENLLEQALVMIAELYPNAPKLKVNLKLGLPYKLYDDNNCVDELKSKFPTGQVIKYTVNGEHREAEINSVSIEVEGYSAFMSMIEKLGVKQRVLVIDVGGETTDLCSFRYDYIENEYEYEKAYTINKGVISLTNEIATNINKDICADISGEQIDCLLRSGQATVFYGGEEHLIANYLGAIEPSVKTIINEIVNEYGKLDGYYILGVGGGYDTFNAIANQHIKANIELSADDRFYANCLGYLD